MSVAQSILDPAPATQRPGALYWASVLLIPVVFIALMDQIDRPPALGPALAHTSALRVISAANEPPDFSAAAAELLRLPDAHDPAVQGYFSAWYRTIVRAETQPTGLWTVYLPWTHGNFAVYVNGELVGSSAPMTRPYPFFREPLYYQFPATLLQAGDNVVHVRLAFERIAALAPFYVGPDEQLRPAYEKLYLLQISVQQATLAVLGVLALLMLGLFWIRPSETAYAWYAAANATWAAHIWLLLESRILIDDARAWTMLPIVALQWFTIFSALFINRLPGCGGPRRKLEAAFVIVGLVSSGLLMLVNFGVWFRDYVYVPITLAIGLSILWRLIVAVRRRPTFEVKLWLLGSTASVLVGLRDHLYDLDIIKGGTQHYLAYTVSILLIVVGLTMLSRITRALTEAETLNRELESRVAAKGAELERNYAEMRVLERERVLSAERERMTRDMHDGIGGQLMHALSVVESKPEYRTLEPLLRGSLDDLRLIIDAVDPSGGDLLAVLSNFRARNERRVREAGLNFVWEVTDLPEVSDFGPNKALQLLRILQEAVTNVLRHAHATELTLRTGLQDEQGGTRIVVEVIDNGRGYEGSKSGRGLGNMRRRAQMVDATIELTSDSSGSRVRLMLPA